MDSTEAVQLIQAIELRFAFAEAAPHEGGPAPDATSDARCLQRRRRRPASRHAARHRLAESNSPSAP